MSTDIGDRLAIGRSLVEKAGRIALGHFRTATLAIASKGVGDVVTEADIAIERLARETIAPRYPHDAFVGEEFGGEASNAGFTWLIDPVDGTVNFARGIGYFCVSLALLQDGRPCAAWILDPLAGELFHADPAGRAFLGDRPIRASDEAVLDEAVIGLGFSGRHAPELFGRLPSILTGAGAEFRRLGAGALCLAHVAAGRLEAYVEPHMNPWDAVGGLYIAASAGAHCLDYVGAGGLIGGAPVFAAGPALAARLLQLLPEPFFGTPPHLDNEQRSAGEAATLVASPNPTSETTQ